VTVPLSCGNSRGRFGERERRNSHLSSNKAPLLDRAGSSEAIKGERTEKSERDRVDKSERDSSAARRHSKKVSELVSLPSHLLPVFHLLSLVYVASDLSVQMDQQVSKPAVSTGDVFSDPEEGTLIELPTRSIISSLVCRRTSHGASKDWFDLRRGRRLRSM
jgi:hypothetical protein